MRVGPYSLHHLLGAGGMGEVWKAQRSAMAGAASKTVAVKLLARDKVRDPSFRRMFIAEARLSMQLGNSNIVQVSDVGETEDGTIFMEMEWIDGLNLSQLNERLWAIGRTIPRGIAAYIVGEVLKALDYAHDIEIEGKRQAIVHRDVTPQNVMLSVAGEVKLTDFGIARLTSDVSSGTHLKGKPRYMAPELFRGVRAPSIDLFAVGAILHEMLTGQKFRGYAKDDAQLLGFAYGGEIPPLPHGLPIELEKLLRGLLELDPADRFASARAAYGMLRRWQGHRDTKFELAEIVRTCLGTTGPRATVMAPTEPLPKSSSKPTSTKQPMQAVEQSETSVGGDETRPEVIVPSAPARRQDDERRNNARLLSMALVVLAFGFATFAVARTVKLMKGGEEVAEAPVVEAPVASEPTPAVETPPMTAAPPVAESPVAAVAGPTESAPVAPAPTVEEGAKKPVGKKQTAQQEPPVPPPVSPATDTVISNSRPATIGAPAYDWVELKIGNSKTVVLDKKAGSAIAKAWLAPGTYTVMFREKSKDDFEKAGKITVPSEGKLIIRLMPPGQVVLDIADP